MLLTLLFKKLPITEMLIMMSIFFLKYLYSSWEIPLYFSLDFFLDKLSSVLIILSFWISCLMIQTVDNKDMNKNIYKLMIVSLNMILLILFSTTKILTFFVCFELSLIPTLLMILGWGAQPERLQASLYLMIYTMLFSLPFLSIVSYMSESYMMIPLNLEYFKQTLLSNYITAVTFMIFLVKLPMFFFHFWLPKAHVQAPLAGSMILAGLLLKMGGYGIIRFFEFYNKMFYLFCAISSAGMILICLVCLMSTDVKMIIAYSSINHMNFMISGLMMFNICSISGSTMMMLSHGLISSSMFFLADVSYKRYHSRSLFIQKAYCLIQPILSMWWFTITVLNLGLPPTMGSISEIVLSACLIKTIPMMQIPVMLYLFFSAFYSIYLYYILNHGSNEESQNYLPMNVKEMMIMFFHIYPLVMLILYMNYFI